MEPVYEKSFSVRSYEIDSRGRVRPTALLNYIQEAAGDHALLLGVAVRDLFPQRLTWVISRMHLTLPGSISSRDELVVRTWPSTREGRFTCREFELFSAGRLTGAATASFAVLDISTRRPISIDERLPPYPLLARRAVADNFATIPRLTDPESELSFRVGRGDLDINNHVNNVVYAEWALETVPATVADESFLLDMEIAYRAETLYGETVVSRCGSIPDPTGSAFLHQLWRPGDNAELARIITRWRR